MIYKYGLYKYRTHTHTKLSSIEHHRTENPASGTWRNKTSFNEKKSLSYDHLHHKLSNLQPRHRLHSFTSIYIYTYMHTFNYCFKKNLNKILTFQLKLVFKRNKRCMFYVYTIILTYLKYRSVYYVSKCFHQSNNEFKHLKSKIFIYLEVSINGN